MVAGPGPQSPQADQPASDRHPAQRQRGHRQAGGAQARLRRLLVPAHHRRAPPRVQARRRRGPDRRLPVPLRLKPPDDATSQVHYSRHEREPRRPPNAHFPVLCTPHPWRRSTSRRTPAPITTSDHACRKAKPSRRLATLRRQRSEASGPGLKYSHNETAKSNPAPTATTPDNRRATLTSASRAPPTPHPISATLINGIRMRVRKL